MPDRPTLLIAALCGRAIAASARRAGYAPLVADLFCDDDTRACAQACVRVEGTAERVLASEPLLTALTKLAGDEPVAGFVYGTGLEADPALIDRIAARWTLLGNSGTTVARLKDPVRFAELCRSCTIPHPEVSLQPPPDRRGWLAKQCGGCGGSHIRPADAAEAADARFYFQRRVAGRPMSALFLADGRRPLVLGFSEQWTAGGCRYAGALQPADLTRQSREARPFSPREKVAAERSDEGLRSTGKGTSRWPTSHRGGNRRNRVPSSAASGSTFSPGEKEVAATIERIVQAIPVVGLNSADFLVTDDGFHLLEINPRPGATLDIFEPEAGSLLALHIEACAGRLPDAVPTFPGVSAAEIVYADRDIVRMPQLDWPDWAADRQPAGSFVARDKPLCTVIAKAATRAETLRLLRARATTILAAASGRAA